MSTEVIDLERVKSDVPAQASGSQTEAATPQDTVVSSCSTAAPTASSTTDRKTEKTRNHNRPVPPPSELKLDSGEYVRLRKDFTGQDAQIRFSMLKDWVSINMLALLRRASGDWKTASDLITIVPAHLAPEAEILHHGVLLVGTHGHSEKLAIPIRHLAPSSIPGRWFDFVRNGLASASSPAVLQRSGGEYELVAKGGLVEGHLGRIADELSDSQDAALCGILTQTIEAFLRQGTAGRLTITQLECRGFGK